MINGWIVRAQTFIQSGGVKAWVTNLKDRPFKINRVRRNLRQRKVIYFLFCILFIRNWFDSEEKIPEEEEQGEQ